LAQQRQSIFITSYGHNRPYCLVQSKIHKKQHKKPKIKIKGKAKIKLIRRKKRKEEKKKKQEKLQKDISIVLTPLAFAMESRADWMYGSRALGTKICLLCYKNNKNNKKIQIQK
jgi:hypothetical protein